MGKKREKEGERENTFASVCNKRSVGKAVGEAETTSGSDMPSCSAGGISRINLTAASRLSLGTIIPNNSIYQIRLYIYIEYYYTI